MSTTLNDIIKEYRKCKFHDANRARWASMGDIGDLCDIGTDFAANNMFSRAVDCWTYIMENEDEFPTEIYVNLGVSFYYGNGVEQDYKKAVSYYQFAADKDHPWGQYNLAVAYEYGKGIQKDINKAIMYYWKAAEQGINEAIDALSRLGVYNELNLSFLPRSFKDNGVVRNYDTLLSQKSKTTELSFDVIRETSKIFYNEYSEDLKARLYSDMQRGINPLNSEPHMYAYMFAFGKMHNAKLRKAYDHLSSEFLQQETVDIVDYGCGQAMGCICYADFLRENGIRQKVRRVVLIEPSELTLKRAALHVSLMFPDAALRTVCKGFDNLLPEDLCSDTDTPTLHILSNVLDMGDKFYNLDRFSDLVAGILKGDNEFVCVGPLFGNDNDLKINRFLTHINIESYFNVQYTAGKFVADKNWTCVIYCGKSEKYSAEYYDYLKKANNGDTKAMVDLAVLFIYGNGVKKSNKKAMYWFRKAADLGYHLAEYNMGVAYEQGLAGMQDIDEAIKYYTKAADKGEHRSQVNLAYLYLGNNGGKLNFHLAIKYICMYAPKADLTAYNHLSILKLKIENWLMEHNICGKIFLKQSSAHKAAIEFMKSTDVSYCENILTLCDILLLPERDYEIDNKRLSECRTRGFDTRIDFREIPCYVIESSKGILARFGFLIPEDDIFRVTYK